MGSTAGRGQNAVETVEAYKFSCLFFFAEWFSGLRLDILNYFGLYFELSLRSYSFGLKTIGIKGLILGILEERLRSEEVLALKISSQIA